MLAIFIGFRILPNLSINRNCKGPAGRHIDSNQFSREPSAIGATSRYFFERRVFGRVYASFFYHRVRGEDREVAEGISLVFGIMVRL